jgi:RNA polymerase sigma-70 factor (ECF subfamily)
MAGISVVQQGGVESWTDEDVIARVMAGEKELYEIIMRRYNPRLYRIARAILREDDEAEDVVQDAYVRAYQHLDQFLGVLDFPHGFRRSRYTERWPECRREAERRSWKR